MNTCILRMPVISMDCSNDSYEWRPSLCHRKADETFQLMYLAFTNVCFIYWIKRNVRVFIVLLYCFNLALFYPLPDYLVNKIKSVTCHFEMSMKAPMSIHGLISSHVHIRSSCVHGVFWIWSLTYDWKCYYVVCAINRCILLLTNTVLSWHCSYKTTISQCRYPNK